MTQHDLYHYGVLGMKWGIKKRTARALGKNKKEVTKEEIKEFENDVNINRKSKGSSLSKDTYDQFNKELWTGEPQRKGIRYVNEVMKTVNVQRNINSSLMAGGIIIGANTVGAILGKINS